jgi:hypothetical protein
VAGHVGLELRNVGANYPFERSHRFTGIQPDFSHRDYLRLSCGVEDTQLGLGARISAGVLARTWVIEFASLRRQELLRLRTDPKMIRLY